MVDWHLEFERWYVGGFLTLFGLATIVWPRAFTSCTCFFYAELRNSRLKDRFTPVLQRRRQLEGTNVFAWRLAGLTAIVFGALVLLRILGPVIGYALLCADLAIVMSQFYLSLRNRSERRAASLQPRTPTFAVPVLWYCGAVLSAALALALAVYPALRVSAVIVAAACFAIVVVALRTAQMAALLAGDDPDIELYVDTRLRWSRVSSLLSLAYAASFFFISVSERQMPSNSMSTAVIEMSSEILFLGFAIWVIARFFFARMRLRTSA